MNLSTTPAKLPDVREDDWKEWILTYIGCQSVTDLAEQMARNLKAASGTIRQELSKVLNGHTYFVEQWLGTEPTAKGKELADRLDMTAEGLRKRFLDLMPRLNQDGLDEKALQYIPLEVASPRRTSPLDELERWLERRNHESPMPDITEDDSLPWTDFCEVLHEIEDTLTDLDPAPTVVVAVDHSWNAQLFRSLHTRSGLATSLGRHRIESMCEEATVFVSESPESVDEEGVVTIKVPFRDVSTEHLVQWGQKLRELSYIDTDTEERVRQFFESIPAGEIERLKPEHLLHAIEDAGDERIDDSPTAFRRRQVCWIRRDLRDDARPLADQWLRDTRDFFRRWIETTGTLHADISGEELDDVLDLEASRDEELSRRDLQDELKQCVLTDSEGVDDLKQRLEKLLPKSLKLAIQESELLKKTKAQNYELSEELRRLGELELPLTLAPDDMAAIDVNASSRLVTDSVRLAQPKLLDAWCRAALEAEPVDQPWAMLAVLDGIAQHPEPGAAIDSELLYRLWASALWATLHRLNGFDESGVDWHYRRFGARIIRGLADELPLFEADSDPLEQVRSLVDERICNQVDRWTGSELSDRERLGRELVALAPFQIPLDEQKRIAGEETKTPPGIYDAGEIELHLARRGDNTARRAILRGISASAAGARDNLEPVELVDWWQQLAGELGEDECSRFEYDFRRAFERFIAQRDYRYPEPLAAALKHDVLWANLPNYISRALEAIESGVNATILCLCDFYGANVSPAPGSMDTILGLAELLDARELLHQVVDIDPVDISDSPTIDLFHTNCTRDDEKRHKRPRLRFSRLQRLAEFRHCSLLLLARLGDAEPLRNSLEERWQVESPRIARQQARWKTLCDAVHPLSSHEEIDVLDDDLWLDTLEALCCQPLEEQRRQLHRMTMWSFPEEQRQRKDVYLLSLQSAPAGDRWALLAPFAQQIWKQRRSGQLQGLWKQIDQIVRTCECNDTWKEPDDLRRQRREWALRHDDETIREWCENDFWVRPLLEDLDGRAEAAWPHMSDEQRHRLLNHLPEGPLDDRWWSRGQELPLKDRLRFARKHGTLTDRRRIARHLLDAESTDAESRLEVWLCELRDAERPAFPTVESELSKFHENLPDTPFAKIPLTMTQRRICNGILSHTPTPDRILEYLPRVAGARLRVSIDARDESGEASESFDELVSVWTIRHLRPVLRDEMTSQGTADLKDRLENLKNQAIKYVNDDTELETYQLRGPIDDAIDEFISDLLENEPPRRQNFDDIETLDEAKENLDSALRRNPEELEHHDVRSLVTDLPDNDAKRMLRKLEKHPQLAENPVIAGVLVLLLDESTLSDDEALKLAKTVLDSAESTVASANGGGTADERRNALVAHLLDTAKYLRRTSLRRLVRSRTKKLLAATDRQ